MECVEWQPNAANAPRTPRFAHRHDQHPLPSTPRLCALSLPLTLLPPNSCLPARPRRLTARPLRGDADEVSSIRLCPPPATTCLATATTSAIDLEMAGPSLANSVCVHVCPPCVPLACPLLTALPPLPISNFSRPLCPRCPTHIWCVTNLHRLSARLAHL